MRNDASMTSDNAILPLPILVPTQSTPTRQTDGWFYETASYSEKDGTNDGILSMPVHRLPYDVDVLKDIPLLEKLKHRDWRTGSLPDELQLADALQRGDLPEAAKIVEDNPEEIVQVESPEPRGISPQERLALYLTDALAQTQYVVWVEKSSGKLRPGLFCKDLNQVTRALVAGSLNTAGGLGACKRCGKLFLKRRALQSYCSTNCRVADAQKRYRKRKKKHQRANKRTKSTKRRPRQ